jgi:hypothetical protein
MVTIAARRKSTIFVQFGEFQASLTQIARSHFR